MYCDMYIYIYIQLLLHWAAQQSQMGYWAAQ